MTEIIITATAFIGGFFFGAAFTAYIINKVRKEINRHIVVKIDHEK